MAKADDHTLGGLKCEDNHAMVALTCDQILATLTQIGTEATRCLELAEARRYKLEEQVNKTEDTCKKNEDELDAIQKRLKTLKEKLVALELEAAKYGRSNGDGSILFDIFVCVILVLIVHYFI